MANAVSICNMALANLGDEATVTSLSPPDGSAQAERCATYFDIAVNTLLESHHWNFATKRVLLAKYVESDRQDWACKYVFPSDCLRIIDINVDGAKRLPPNMAKGLYDYEVSIDSNGRRCIYSNLEDALIRYVTSVDPVLFPPLFVNALAWKMSSFLAGSLMRGAEGAQMTQRCEQMCLMFMQQAMVSDASQHQEWSDSIPEWISGR